MLFCGALMVSLVPANVVMCTDTEQIGIAYLAGARFDLVLDQLRRGEMFPTLGQVKSTLQTMPAQAAQVKDEL